MAPHKRNTELFEIIRSRDSERDVTQLPNWWSRDHEGEARGRGKAIGAWLGTPLHLQLTRGVAVALGVVVVALFVVGFQLGKHAGTGRLSGEERSNQKLAAARGGTINPALLKTERSGQSGGTALNPGQKTAVQAGAAARDPRRVGMNYYCLATMPLKYRAEAEKAVAFLKSNEVDARVFVVQNRMLQVIVLKGFEKPSSREAKRYENLLRSLGRTWKAEHRGWSDWSDLYAIKYKG